MYPNPPNFRSPEPGSAWVIVRNPAGDTVYASQWDALVRMFQQKARDFLLPMVVYGRVASGQCNASGVTRLRDYWEALAGSTNMRRADQITPDGVWGLETADALWTLLCLTNQTQRAQETNAQIEAQTISAEMVRQMVWFALFVTAVDVSARPGTQNYTSTIDGRNLEISPQAVLPTWTTQVVSAPEDRLWVASYRAGTQMPRAPSQAVLSSTTVNPPAEMRLSWFGAALVVAAVGGVTWYFTAPTRAGVR